MRKTDVANVRLDEDRTEGSFVTPIAGSIMQFETPRLRDGHDLVAE
jgi:hypothetical protein